MELGPETTKAIKRCVRGSCELWGAKFPSHQKAELIWGCQMLPHKSPTPGCVSGGLCFAPCTSQSSNGTFLIPRNPFPPCPSPRAHEREQIPALPTLLQQQLPLGIITRFFPPQKRRPGGAPGLAGGDRAGPEGGSGVTPSPCDARPVPATKSTLKTSLSC